MRRRRTLAGPAQEELNANVPIFVEGLLVEYLVTWFPMLTKDWEYEQGSHFPLRFPHKPIITLTRTPSESHFVWRCVWRLSGRLFFARLWRHAGCCFLPRRPGALFCNGGEVPFVRRPRALLFAVWGGHPPPPPQPPKVVFPARIFAAEARAHSLTCWSASGITKNTRKGPWPEKIPQICMAITRISWNLFVLTSRQCPRFTCIGFAGW